MRSESTSALGQPSETKPTLGACWLMALAAALGASSFWLMAAAVAAFSAAGWRESRVSYMTNGGESNIQEVRARGGELFVFADRDTHIEPSDFVHVINLVDHAGPLSPILHVVPLQLLAYHAALARGTDVDKPRNLAKSVTVE